MSFRRRIALVAAAAVAIAVVLASLLVYLLTSNQLHSQVDNQLRSRAHETRRLQRLFAVGALRIGPNGGASIVSAPSDVAIAAKEAEGDKTPKSDERAAQNAEREAADARAAEESLRPGSLFGKLPPSPDQVRGYQQVVNAAGKIARALGAATSRCRSTRRRSSWPKRGGEPFYRDANVNGVHLRVLAEPFGATAPPSSRSR